ncbi:hypothetical protein B0H17DRAFT_1136572 [Mycena rosella]|uniref:Uncharacterized protein n=1 Tax=Mycena rosella TaxID=1033263 RepID=A0AAD7DAR6_MYCRO|nr:hypothetical protein B0H17DRAFT_1136572 [Mycena rosella]
MLWSATKQSGFFLMTGTSISSHYVVDAKQTPNASQRANTTPSASPQHHPNKLQRRNSGADVDRPADPNTDPRETPRVRKLYKDRDPISIDALVLAGASTLNTTTAATFTPESSDDETDVPSAPSFSPPPHSPTHSDTSMDDAPLVILFSLPSKKDLAAHKPACVADNPYFKFQADEEGNAPYKQLNNIDTPTHYVLTPRAERHWAASYTEAFVEKTGNHLIGIIANGGNHIRNTLFDTPFVDQIRKAIRVRAPIGNIEFGSPISVSILIENDIGASGVLAQATYGVHPALRFWVQEYKPEDAKWVIGQHDLVGSPGDDTAAIEAQACAGLVHEGFNNTDTYREVEQTTQALGGASPKRIFDALNTMHAQYIPHPTLPIMVYYMKPISKVLEVQERVAWALRRLKFTSGEYGFRPRSKGMCAVQERATPNLPNVIPGDSTHAGWWGSAAQLSELAPDHPLYPTDGGNNNNRLSGTASCGGGHHRGGGRGGYHGGGYCGGGYFNKHGGHGRRGGHNGRRGGSGRGNSRACGYGRGGY